MNPRRALASLFGAIALLIAPGFAFAQHEGGVGQAPPPPPGPGRLVVQILTSSGASRTGEDIDVSNLPIALYALSPDGTPGLANGTTDATGRFTFEGISTDPSIVYLIGARYAEIPFGERVQFEAGQKEARVEIRVSTPTDQVEGVRVEEIRARLDWMGNRVVVTEILRFESTGDRVIQLPSGGAKAIAERPLPEAARDFKSGPSSIGDELVETDGVVRFYGPLYPGEQRVEYQYSLPVEPEAKTLPLEIELREPAGRLVVIAGTAGMAVSGSGLTESRKARDDDGEPLSSWARGALRGGEPIALEVTLPETRLDPTALTIPRADVWVDLDDTWLNANVDINLEVDPGAPISGTPDAPLLHITLPTGAKLKGVAPDTESMGLVPTRDGGFDVIGPIGPGAHSIGYAYRIPTRPDGTSLDMRFPREVQTLNVLIADTGLALESTRLHRRRPFRNGTRNYLHREAYNVGMDEVVDLRIEPLRARGLPQQASLALTIAAAAAAALFIIAPLRTREALVDEGSDELARLREEREAIYVAITDLDHDFETGKLEEEDYAAMRERFRNDAVALMRSERDLLSGAQAAEGDANAEPTNAPAATAATSRTATATATDTTDTTTDTTAATSAPAATGGFCPSCGGRVDAKWRFCSHCGGALHPAGAGDSSGSGAVG